MSIKETLSSDPDLANGRYQGTHYTWKHLCFLAGVLLSNLESEAALHERPFYIALEYVKKKIYHNQSDFLETFLGKF